MKKSVVLGFAILLACGVASGKDREHRHQAHGKHAGAVDIASFRAADLGVIREYYRARPLPPGIEKHLLRKGSLPPGIAKKIRPFPPELERRLPVLPVGVVRGCVGDRAVVYDPVNRIILDVADIVIATRQL